MRKVARNLLIAILVSFIVLGASPVGSVFADQPQRGTFGAGAGFINPCNGDLFDVEVSGHILFQSNQAIFLIQEHGTGTGTDLVTGQQYAVVWDLVGTNSLGPSGSFTGQGMIILVDPVSGSAFMIQSVANVNFRPAEPSIVEIQDAVCSGSGKLPLV